MNDGPRPGSWYETEDGQTFQVINIEDGRIDVQLLDGRVDEMDMARWAELNGKEIEAPEEWRESMDAFFIGRRPKKGAD